MAEENKKYTNSQVRRDGSKAIIEAEIPAETIEKHKQDIIKEAQKDFEKKGFRKGNVPLNMVEEEMGEEKIMGETANKALNEAYPELIKEHDLKVVSAPKVSVTKFAPGNPLGFKAEVAIVPEFNLSNYRKIGEEVMKEAEKGEVEVSEEELNQIINQILQMYTQAKEKEDKKEKPGNPPASGETETPKLTDEFVKTLGKFENIEDFKNKVRENLKQEKEMARTRENRENIADRLIKETELEIPEAAVEGELQSIRQRLEEDLKNKDMTMDEYMEKMGTTEEEFIKEQRNHIEKQLKTKIILEKIAEEEGIEPDEKQVELQAQMLKQRYPHTEDATLKNYVRMMLKNESVLKLLEDNQSEEKKED